jgi:hypothetical protein
VNIPKEQTFFIQIQQKKSLKKKVNKTSMSTDTFNVGVIVPLPNHYNSDMPQGHGAVWIAIFRQLFFYGLIFGKNI